MNGELASEGRVLIVDDDTSTLCALNEALGSCFSTNVATSGARGLEIAAGQPVELILLDLMMPDMDGYEVCRRLKERPETAEIPVIFVTAVDDVGDEATAFEVGAVDYITKPIRPAIVRARVRTHLQLKRQRDRLEQLSMVDTLTGLANRRRFDDHYQREWRLAARNLTPLSVLLADIDFFKLYNDAYGHPAGDRCLRAIAQALDSTVCRPTDLTARYGGEEFICVLPRTDAAGAAIVAQRFCDVVAELRSPHQASKAGSCVSVSVGGATIVPSRSDSPAALVESADRRLYEAKARGRGRVCCVDGD